LIWENEDRAIQLATEGIHYMEAIGDQDRASVLRTRYVMYLTEVGDFQEAVHQLEQLHNVAFTYNSRFLYLEHQRLWAFLAWNMGKYELAAQYCQEVLEYRESLPADIAQLAIYMFTRVCLSQGNCSQMQTYLRVFYKQIYHPWHSFKMIQVLGILAVREGQMQLAATLFGAQDSLWERGGRHWYKLSPRERSENEPALAAAREALGEENFARGWDTGRAMTVEQILQFARGTIDDVNSSTPP